MKKFYRSRTNRMISGLCGGLGETLNVDVTLIRILVVVLAFVSSGTVIFIYFIASLIVPKAPDIFNPYQSQGGLNGPGGYGGSNRYNHTNPNDFHHPDQSQYSSQRSWQTPPTQQPYSNVDSMMDDLEKKALRNEIELLKKKLNEVEKKGE